VNAIASPSVSYRQEYNETKPVPYGLLQNPKMIDDLLPRHISNALGPNGFLIGINFVSCGHDSILATGSLPLGVSPSISRIGPFPIGADQQFIELVGSKLSYNGTREADGCTIIGAQIG
jgi:hypothetical protein